MEIELDQENVKPSETQRYLKVKKVSELTNPCNYLRGNKEQENILRRGEKPQIYQQELIKKNRFMVQLHVKINLIMTL